MFTQKGFAMKYILLAATMFTFIAPASADEASHKQAAEKLVAITSQHSSMVDSNKQMIERQIADLKKLPCFNPTFEKDVRGLLGQMFDFEQVKNDSIKLFKDSFTEQELIEMTKFYESPLGQKTMREMPKILKASFEANMKRAAGKEQEVMKVLSKYLDDKGECKK
jgi:uncharacterized protein